MKKLSLFFLLCVSHLMTHAQIDNPRPVDSKIERVTVFLSGAQVTRSASASLSAGKNQLVFTNISPNINVQSIQVKGEGNFTVLSVVHQLNYLNEQEKTKEIETLQAQYDINRQRIEDESVRLQVLKEEEALILKNQSLAGEQGVKLVELKETADFYRTRLTEIKLKQLDITRGIQKINQGQVKISRQLSELNALRDMSTSEIVVAINAKAATTGKFAISYLVNNAGWKPTYDLRVRDISNPIELMYKANVFQLSGEDWKDVKLTMSTGNPSQSGTKPELNAWYLQFTPYYAATRGNVIAAGAIEARTTGSNFDPATNTYVVSGRVLSEDGALPGATVVVKGTTTGTATDMEGNFLLRVTDPNAILVFSFVGYESQEVRINNQAVMNVTLKNDSQALSEVVVTGRGTDNDGWGSDPWGNSNRAKAEKTKDKKQVNAPMIAIANQSQAQTSVEFNIDIPYNIPNDGKMYMVDMQQYAVPAYYEYSCAPKLDTDVFLMARITGWEEYNLIDGEANLFFEGTFLGKSVLSVKNITDTLNISLGRDKNIVVTRTKLKNYTSKQFIGSSKKETREWEINVRNKKQQAINIVIEDQFPLTTDKEIEIERISSSGATIDESTGKLTWKFSLPPAESKKMEVKYSVKYPKRNVMVLE